MAQAFLTASAAQVATALGQHPGLNFTKRSGGGNRWYVSVPLIPDGASYPVILDCTETIADMMGVGANYNGDGDKTLSFTGPNNPDLCVQAASVAYSVANVVAYTLGD